MATTTATPTISVTTGIDTISSTTGVDTIAKFIYGADLSINSVYLPFERDQTTDTPYSLFKTIDKDGSVTNYHGTFVRETSTSPITSGSKITSFEGTNASGVQQFSFATSKSYDGINLKEAVKANDKVTFFNIILGGNDSLVGSSQDDVLGGYKGNDTIDGGFGNDKAFFSGNYADYQITPVSKINSFLTIKNTKTNEIDYLTNVESLQFLDQTIATPTSNVEPIPTPVTLTGSTLNLFANALNMNQVDLSNDSVIPSATQIKMLGGDGGFTIFDGKFAYDANGIPTSASTVSAVHDYLPPSGTAKNFDLVLGTNNNALKIAQYFDKLDGQGLFNYILFGNDIINGSSQNDTLSGYAGNDTINGNGGLDTVFFSGNFPDYKITPQPGTALSADTFVTVQNTKTGEIDSLINVESLQFLDKTIATPTSVTTATGITITAPAAFLSNTSKVNASNVTTAGDDKIISTIANLTNATIDGGAGNDTLTLSDAGIFGTESITSIETLQLANGSTNRVFVGSRGGESISTVTGGAGNDIISYFNSNGSINAAGGDDAIAIEGNNNTVTGGSGKDQFLIMTTSSSASISKATFTDFISGTDKLSLSGIPIPVSSTSSNSAMINAPVSFLGNKANFAQTQKTLVANASKLQVVYEQDKNILWADVNNDGALNTSDLQITLNGVKTLAAADFV